MNTRVEWKIHSTHSLILKEGHSFWGWHPILAIVLRDNCVARPANSFSAKRFIIITSGRAPSLLGVATTKVRFLGIWVSVWVGGSVAAVKPPQAVLPAKKITLTLLPASPRPIFRLFCSDTIVVLRRYWAEREVDANGVLWRWGLR